MQVDKEVEMQLEANRTGGRAEKRHLVGDGRRDRTKCIMYLHENSLPEPSVRKS